ncbi:MAG: M23 family metallopeptidase [Gracilimonas sp.]
MKLIWIVFIPLFFIFPQDRNSVSVYRVENDEGIDVYVRNNNIYPVTIELELELENLEPDKNLPFISHIAPNSATKVLTLAFKDKSEGWDYRSKYKYYMGSIFAQHNDSYAYRLPFPVGKTFKIDQGFGGAFSHQGELQYALDINMPTGTAIYAARPGKVVMTEESNNQGGNSTEFMNDANYITILHEDGTFADYSHLKYNGVEVKEGQQVRAGQLIGFSGATGYATGPHLHFVVKKAKRGGGFISIPVKFATKDGIIELKEGESYVGY